MSEIIISLPIDVPVPKFRLFQKVIHCNQEGTVTGMAYTSALEALAEDSDRPGWIYQVSYMFGKYPEEALDADERDSFVPEEKLSAGGEG